MAIFHIQHGCCDRDKFLKCSKEACEFRARKLLFYVSDHKDETKLITKYI